MGVTRRSFISFVVGGAVGTALTPIPFKMMDDVSIWTQNWPWIPKLDYGELSKKASISKLAGSGLPIQVLAIRTIRSRRAAWTRWLPSKPSCSTHLLGSRSR